MNWSADVFGSHQESPAFRHGECQYGDWIKKPGVAICSCNDGLRPVIFKLEATEQEAYIEYEPVR